MILRRATFKLLVLAMGLSVVGTGCGSMSNGISSHPGTPSTLQPATGAPVHLSDFTVTADPLTGKLTFQSSPGTVQSARALGTGSVHSQATQYTRGDLTLAGTAVYNTTTHILSGNVTLSNSSHTTYHSVKAIVTSISSSSVSVSNPSGTTSLTGTNKQYWDFSDLGPNFSDVSPASQPSPVTRNWQFNVPSGSSFTFTVAVYANVWSSPPGDGGAILGLWFVDGSPAKGWAVGESGKILVTKDGGQHWTAQTSNAASDLEDVCFIDGDHGWAVGKGSVILVTSNGGKTWRYQLSGAGGNGDYYGVSFRDANNGCIVGYSDPSGLSGIVLVTQDGGATWQPVGDPAGAGLRHVRILPNGVAWAAGNNVTMISSFDGGFNWNPTTLPGLGNVDPLTLQLYQLLGLDFTDSIHGWVVGRRGSMWRTVDAGTTWSKLSVPLPSGQTGPPNLTAVKFISSTKGWISTDNGHVLATSDGGNSWTDQSIPTLPGSTLAAIGATKSGTAWVGGPGGSIITLGPSSGNQWSTTLGGSNSDLQRVQFTSRSRGYATGANGTLLTTSDGGRTWQPLATPPPVVGTIYGMHFLNDQTGWIVGMGGQIYSTTNGGATWNAESMGSFPLDGNNSPFTPDLRGIYMLDANTGWIVGSGGSTGSTGGFGGSTAKVGAILFRNASTHGQWMAYQGIQFVPDLYDVKFIGTFGVIVGANSTVLLSVDGVNWMQATPVGLPSTANSVLRSVAIAPGPGVWIVGDGGYIARLSSDATSWQRESSVATKSLRSARFLDLNNGWIVGDGGTVLHTTDGGQTWNRLPGYDDGTSRDLLGIDFFDSDTGAAVGKGGVIKTFR